MMIERLKAQFAAALRGPRPSIERMGFGGTFYISVDDGPWVPAKNTVMLAALDDILSKYFHNGSPPTAFYIAPFSTDVEPSSSLTGATFPAAQGEYTGYTQTTRPQWVPNGGSVSQTVTNSSAPAVFTIGASPATITGAALIATDSARGGTTGVLIAAARFAVANTLNAGSTLKVQYALAGAPAA